VKLFALFDNKREIFYVQIKFICNTIILTNHPRPRLYHFRQYPLYI